MSQISTSINHFYNNILFYVNINFSLCESLGKCKHHRVNHSTIKIYELHYGLNLIKSNILHLKYKIEC